ncbi:TonB-dependent receptor [Pacificimonas flava]|uniref:TonB-dependent receptor n=2 Tax=Pacificimonas TaxID=1960290 RepID=A0A219B428_9SPHN|nr:MULTISPECIES: TonB-dependent receptor [Pacificimonas]MBZ6377146.1 TonB-dependent receptor [Pacificimonas aurantium]OWV33130.1 TonB-dependent receptor [Pacificimonas flava]
MNILVRQSIGRAVRLNGSALAIAAATLTFASAAYAQEAAAEAPDSAIDAPAAAGGSQVASYSQGGAIVVTATRREASTQDLPLAITAVDGEAVDDAAAYSFESFARLNPSVQVNNRGVGDNQIVLRGISSAGKPTVGLYYDEAIITGLGLDGGSDNQPNIQLHDVERVEVLKGPQGTIFGASSMSGTVRVIANKPNLYEFRGGATGSGALVEDGNGLLRGEAFLDAPIVSGAAGVRAVVWGNSGGGYIDRIGDRPAEDVNDSDVWGGRAIFLAEPTDAVTLTFTALHQETGADGSQYFEFDQGAYNATSPTVETFDDNIDLYSAVADVDVGVGTLTATSSYFERDMLQRRDSTPTAIRFGIPVDLAYVEGQELTNWTSEVRFSSDFAGPFQLLLGGFYGEQRVDESTAALVADEDTGLPPCIDARECRALGFGAADINSGYGSVDTDQYAVFGEANLEIIPGLTGTVGARYYKADIREQTIQTQGLRFPTSPVQTEEVLTLDTDESEDKVSYNFALAWEATTATTFYGRVASGFRPGGANNAAAAADQGITVPAQYEADELWNYEIGAKSWLLDRLLYVELALYHIDWSNQQISVTDPGGTFVYISNAGKTEVNGVELQINAQPAKGLSTSFGVTYTDSTLAEDMPSTAEVAGLDGDTLPYSPKWAFAGQLGYEGEISSTVEGYVSTDFNYRGESATSFNDSDPNYAELDDYFLLNGQVGVRFDNHADVSLFVDNILDTVPQIGLRISGDGYRVYTTRPRTIGLRASFDF